VVRTTRYLSSLQPGALSERLDRLEERADHLHVPIAYMYMLYTLKHHISLVRQRLRDRGPGHDPPKRCHA
jgi:hypothetical protein